MTSTVATVKDYVATLPDERRDAVGRIVEILDKELPAGFKSSMGYGMPYWVVPHSLYPAGYHCDPKLPLGFVGLASQKNFIALYHMGLYSSPDLLEWFVAEYPKHSKAKLDMGKSCIRFKKPADIPYDLIAELASKMTPQQWIELYESTLNSPREVRSKK